MRTWVVHEPGGVDALQLEEREAPTVRAGDVLIEVHARGLNRSELYTRRGDSGDAVTFPRVLGIEAVGVVVDPGDTDLRAGQTVAAAMGNMGRLYDGGYGPLTSVPRSNVFPIETDLDWVTFAALPETYLTAWGVILAIEPRPAEPVLVRGGTSSVGMAAISILSDMGSPVIATTRNPAKHDALIAAGADEVVIDTGEIAHDVVGLIGEPVSAVVELVGRPSSVRDSADCLTSGGVIGHVGMLGDDWDWMNNPPDLGAVELRFYNSEKLHTDSATPALQTIVERIEAGRYRPNLHQRFAYTDMRAAHQVMEQSGAAGKLVVES